MPKAPLPPFPKKEDGTPTPRQPGKPRNAPPSTPKPKPKG